MPVQLSDQLASALRIALGEAPPVAATPMPIVVYPRIEKISGVNMMLKAPITALYHPSAQDWVFGHNDGTFIWDPSNGDEVGKPLRNAAGFPLVYAVGLEGGKKIAIGEPSVNYGAFGNPGTAAPAQSNQSEWDHWGEVFKANVAAANTGGTTIVTQGDGNAEQPISVGSEP